MKRKICVVTGSRAEYGLLKPLLEEIKKDPELELQLIVTGMHLSPEFGLTYKEIEADGIPINEKIEMLLSSDSALSISKAMGLALISFPEAYQRLRPDVVVVLGDRFEIYAASVSALVSRIPIAHIHGGERTEGAMDEALRHSITKMSHLHFTATEEYSRRVEQMGEHPCRVFTTGALGVDVISRIDLLSREDLEKELGRTFLKHLLLVTFHPVTLEPGTARDQFGSLLKVIEDQKDTLTIFTKANADTGGRVINAMIDDYVAEHKDTSCAFYSLGYKKYLSVMRYADAVAGNSSSGIIEAPSFKIGTINIGDRQKGRMSGESVIDCEPTEESIKKAFVVLYSPEFQERLKAVTNIYGKGNTAVMIKDILKTYDLSNLLKKEFYNLPFSGESD